MRPASGEGHERRRQQLSRPSYLPLTSDTKFGPGSVDPGSVDALKEAAEVKVLLETTLTLQAGEMRRVFGRLEATRTGTPGLWLEMAQFRCLDSTGQQSGTAASTGTNHEGSGGAYSPPGHLVLDPPCCSGRQAREPTSVSSKLRPAISTTPTTTPLRSRPLNPALGGTWLQASSSDELGAQWWQNPDCDSEGKQPTCSYVGGSTPPELWIFQNDGTHLDFWEAARNATAASVSATVTLTTCHHATASCTDDHEGSSDGSTVSTHLELVQLTPGLGICRVNRSPDATYAITGNAHHYSIHYELDNVPISATCGGSRLFEVYIDMKQVSGNPVKIDGTRPGPGWGGNRRHRVRQRLRRDRTGAERPQFERDRSQASHRDRGPHRRRRLVRRQLVPRRDRLRPELARWHRGARAFASQPHRVTSRCDGTGRAGFHPVRCGGQHPRRLPRRRDGVVRQRLPRPRDRAGPEPGRRDNGGAEIGSEHHRQRLQRRSLAQVAPPLVSGREARVECHNARTTLLGWVSRDRQAALRYSLISPLTVVRRLIGTVMSLASLGSCTGG